MIIFALYKCACQKSMKVAFGCKGLIKELLEKFSTKAAMFWTPVVSVKMERKGGTQDVQRKQSLVAFIEIKG